MILKEQTIYIPVYNKEPENEGSYYTNIGKVNFSERFTDSKYCWFINGIEVNVLYWLNPIENYVFTKEELIDLLSEAGSSGYHAKVDEINGGRSAGYMTRFLEKKGITID